MTILLFLDCDVRIGDNFIKKYIDFRHESEVIVGGVSYTEYEQLEKSKRLSGNTADTERTQSTFREIKDLTLHLAHVIYSLIKKLVRILDLQKA